MLSTSLVALLLAATPIGCAAEPIGARAVPTAPVADSLLALYRDGRTWQQFLDATSARRQTWLDNTAAGAPDPAQVARARAVGGHWLLLVVAEDWCGDSANTIPYLARLVEEVPQLEMRLVNATEGRAVMESHRTEDGRPATPTVVLLDAAGEERGCWVERPYALRRVVADLKAGVTTGNQVEVITAWRAGDRGRTTVGDLVDLLESAAAGVARCP